MLISFTSYTQMHANDLGIDLYMGGDGGGQLGTAEIVEIHLSIINGVAWVIFLGSTKHRRQFVIGFLLRLRRQ